LAACACPCEAACACPCEAPCSRTCEAFRHSSVDFPPAHYGAQAKITQNVQKGLRQGLQVGSTLQLRQSSASETFLRLADYPRPEEMPWCHQKIAQKKVLLQ